MFRRLKTGFVLSLFVCSVFLSACVSQAPADSAGEAEEVGAIEKTEDTDNPSEGDETKETIASETDEKADGTDEAEKTEVSEEAETTEDAVIDNSSEINPVDESVKEDLLVAYKDFVKQQDFYDPGFLFVNDLDEDNIPELFIVSEGNIFLVSYDNGDVIWGGDGMHMYYKPHGSKCVGASSDGESLSIMYYEGFDKEYLEPVKVVNYDAFTNTKGYDEEIALVEEEYVKIPEIGDEAYFDSIDEAIDNIWIKGNESSGQTVSEADKLLDAFINNEIPASYESGDEEFFISDLMAYNQYEEIFSVGERLDLDNDGENEQIINNLYGGIYIDASNGSLKEFTGGYDSASQISYTEYDDAVWIVHSDDTHQGREVYELTRYEGADNIVDSFELRADYWNNYDETGIDEYNETNEFHYRDKAITMAEYDKLKAEIFGK
ncbi:MAG: hypothetical protein K6B28_06985 [Lachnospiraceae bacterium]|nr:hypothetical protein [Lachnospiraceae bacterium]